MVAPTFGDEWEARYGDRLLGLTTTSWHGAKKATQYTRIYKLLGETKGYGGAHIDKEWLAAVRAWARSEGYRFAYELPVGHPIRHNGDVAARLMPSARWHDLATYDARLAEVGPERIAEFYYFRDGKPVRGDGASYKIRTVKFFKKVAEADPAFPDGLRAGLPEHADRHGGVRGIYYHPARPPEERPAAIREWFERWGLPRFERTKDATPPYTSGLDG
jgi:hypothetical protein